MSCHMTDSESAEVIIIGSNATTMSASASTLPSLPLGHDCSHAYNFSLRIVNNMFTISCSSSWNVAGTRAQNCSVVGRTHCSCRAYASSAGCQRARTPLSRKSVQCHGNVAGNHQSNNEWCQSLPRKRGVRQAAKYFGFLSGLLVVVP